MGQASSLSIGEWQVIPRSVGLPHHELHHGLLGGFGRDEIGDEATPAHYQNAVGDSEELGYSEEMMRTALPSAAIRPMSS